MLTSFAINSLATRYAHSAGPGWGQLITRGVPAGTRGVPRGYARGTRVRAGYPRGGECPMKFPPRGWGVGGLGWMGLTLQQNFLEAIASKKFCCRVLKIHLSLRRI